MKAVIRRLLYLTVNNLSELSEEAHAEGANVLVYAPESAAEGAAVCCDFLAVAPPSQTNALLISYNRVPDD